MSDKRRFRLPRRKKKDEGAATDEVVDAENESAATVSEEAGSITPRPERSGRSLFRRRRRGSDAPVVGAGLMRPFNLAPQPTVVEKTPTVGVGKLVAVGVVLAGIAGLGLLYVSASSDRDDAIAERDDLQEILERPPPAIGGAAPDANENALFADQLFRETAIAGVLTERVSWDRVLGSISRVAPEETWFTSMATAVPSGDDTPAPAPPPATGEGEGDDAPAPVAPATPVDPADSLHSVSLNGFADDHETLAVLMGRLSALRELEDVRLESSGGTLIGDTEVVQFSVSASVTPGRTS